LYVTTTTRTTATTKTASATRKSDLEKGEGSRSISVIVKLLYGPIVATPKMVVHVNYEVGSESSTDNEETGSEASPAKNNKHNNSTTKASFHNKRRPPPPPTKKVSFHDSEDEEEEEEDDEVDRDLPRRIPWSSIRIQSLVASGTFSRIYRVQVVPPAPVLVPASKRPIPSKKKKNKKTTAKLPPPPSSLVSPLGKHANPNQVYALKCLDGRRFPAEACFFQALDDLACEADVLSQVANHNHNNAHVNVITLYGIAASGSSNDLYGSGFFLLMDLISETLKDKLHSWRNQLYLRGGNRNWATVVTGPVAVQERLTSIALGVARGMQHLHHHNVVHCNLQPTSIGFVFEQQQQPKIFGFQLAHGGGGGGDGASGKPTFLHRDDPSSLVGSDTVNTRYMAPELILAVMNGTTATATTTPACDVYSFGLILFELLTLQKPYCCYTSLFQLMASTTTAKTSRRHDPMTTTTMTATRHWKPSLQHVSSPRLKRLLLECWSVQAKSRPTFHRIVKVLEREVSSYERNNDTDEKQATTTIIKGQHSPQQNPPRRGQRRPPPLSSNKT
jgi:serine/threonine protein kinase